MRCEKHDPKNTAALEPYINAGLPCPRCVVERLDRIAAGVERLCDAAEAFVPRCAVLQTSLHSLGVNVEAGYVIGTCEKPRGHSGKHSFE